MRAFMELEQSGMGGVAFVERRFFPRFKLALQGLCSVELGPDAACTSFDMSISGIALKTGIAANVGDAVIASFREFGMAKGHVARTFEGGFAMAFDNIDPHRSRLAQYLIWWVRGAERDNGERREHDRIVPLNRLMTIARADGRASVGRVENVSRSGVAFTSTSGFTVGERLLIGKHPSTIVRVFDDGAAAEFDVALDAEGFDVMISFAKLP